MKIEIDDSLSGQERQERIRYFMIKYALQKFGYCKVRAAKWLGISIRTMRNWCEPYHEFSHEILKGVARESGNKLTKRIISHLPETFEQCSATLFFQYASPKLKKAIREYYQRKVVIESESLICEHTDFTVQLRKINDVLVATRICVKCNVPIKGITKEEEKWIWSKYKEYGHQKRSDLSL